jgi:hypothetical protein
MLKRRRRSYELKISLNSVRYAENKEDFSYKRKKGKNEKRRKERERERERGGSYSSSKVIVLAIF